ncbi:MAG: YqgE/AlgH family protein, partial [Verrucomicrobiota bacterium]
FGAEIRAFLGYAGWSKGQLESERQQHAWIISGVNGHMMEGLDGTAMWREIISSVSPELMFLADAPEDPEVN